MRVVSQAYKQAIMAHRHGLRKAPKAEVYFGVIDYTAKPDSTLAASNEAPFSDSANMYNNARPIVNSYATWERDFFRLDGTQLLLPNDGDYAAQGFVSAAVSDEAGYFSDPPFLDISFGETHSVVGLTIDFDILTGQYPLDFTVTTWRDGALLNDYEVTDNDTADYRGEFGLDDFDRLRIEFTRARPYQRVRINSLTFGVGYTYGGDDLISVTHKRAAHPLSLSVPESELRFTLFNEDGKFKVDSNTSIVRFLMEGQQAVLRYGLEVDDDGNIEWFQAGIFELSSWSTEGFQATFVAQDIFSQLTGTTYHKGTYSIADPKSAGQLASEVLQDAGLEHFEVSNEIAYTALPLPIASHAECLQYVANLSSSILEQKDNSAIVMRTTRDVSPDEWGISKTPDDAPEMDFSQIQNIVPDSETVQYATWEQDFFALDGEMKLPPDNGNYLATGAVFDIFPLGEQYPTAGILIDLTVPFTFGEMSIGFSKYSAISKFRLIGIRDSGDNYQRDFSVTGPITTVSDYFTNIRYLYIYPLENPKQQRMRIDYVSVAAQVWPQLTYDDVLGNAKDELMPAARDISIRFWPTHNLIPERDPAQVQELMHIKIMPGELTEIQHSAAYYHVQASSTAPGVAFDIEEHYAYVSFIQVSGASNEVEIILSGMVDERASAETLREHMGDRGTDIIVENPISSDIDGGVADQLEWFVNYYRNRVQYEVETLGFPEVDAADFMTFEGKPAIVLENTITFNGGAMRGKMKFRGRASEWLGRSQKQIGEYSRQAIAGNTTATGSTYRITHGSRAT